MSKSSALVFSTNPAEFFSKQLADTELRTFYFSLAEMINQAEHEPVAEALRSMRMAAKQGKTHPAQEIIRRLLAIRIALMRGDPMETTDWLEINVSGYAWLEAERTFVNGYVAYQNKQYSAGIRLFSEAARKFEILQMWDRCFLADFNSLIGDLEKENPISLTEQLKRLRDLERRIHDHLDHPGCARTLALVHRQRAHAFEDTQRLHAALEEVTQAASIFRLNGSQKDYYLALLHAADLALDLGEINRARTFYEYVIGPVDVQVEFPLAVIAWRLGGEIPHYDAFTQVPQNWREKFERLLSQEREAAPVSEIRGWLWSLKENLLTSAEGLDPIPLKPSGMEARLLKILMREKVTKSFLIETFWPEKNETACLDNRLHRLISRFNQKADLIQFDGKRYGLKKPIRFSA